MIEKVLFAVGVVLSVEGLVFAIAPARLDRLLDALRNTSAEARRLIGLLGVAIGAGCLVLSGLLAPN